MGISGVVSLLKRGRIWAGVGATVGLASSIFVVVGSAGGAAAAQANPTAGLTLAFTASFSGSALNTSQWDTCYTWFTPSKGCTNFGNSQEEEWYLPSQDQVSGGGLRMVASATPTAGTTKTGAAKTYPYRSGMITTYNSFNFTYGYVQIVAKLPGGTGTWPALWLVPKATQWPPEIDIMENWGTPTRFRGTYHWTTQDPQQQGFTISTGVNLTDTFNTYGMLWEPGSLTWYFDKKPVATFTGAGVSNIPMYLIANLAIDGSAPSPSNFDLQSVQVYEGTPSKASTPSTPGTSAGASPTTTGSSTTSTASTPSTTTGTSPTSTTGSSTTSTASTPSTTTGTSRTSTTGSKPASTPSTPKTTTGSRPRSTKGSSMASTSSGTSSSPSESGTNHHSTSPQPVAHEDSEPQVTGQSQKIIRLDAVDRPTRSTDSRRSRHRAAHRRSRRTDSRHRVRRRALHRRRHRADSRHRGRHRAVDRRSHRADPRHRGRHRAVDRRSRRADPWHRNVRTTRTSASL